MPLYALAFLAGDLLLQLFAELPNPVYIYSALVFAVAAYCLLPRWRKITIVATMFICGSLLTFLSASSLLSWQLPSDKEGVPIEVVGSIHTIPISDSTRNVFNFKLDDSGAIVRLYWLGSNHLYVGDKWRLSAKLKRIHDVKNPGSFDYQAWALQNGIRATGSVLPNGNNKLISHQWYFYPVATLRQNIRSQLIHILPHTATSPWLIALIVGERSNINPDSWQVLKNTGTNHLMAIAGLHIGFISGFVALLTSWCWRRHPRASLFIPASKVGSWCALIVAVFYSLLSGFLVPAQRACLMLTAFILSGVSRREIPAWHIWSLALISVLMLNPLTVLTESFWLSFMTLAIIIYGMDGRLQPTGIWWKYFRIQWVIGFGLTPLSMLFFQQVSTVSFFANMIAIPWLGFLVLPFCVLTGMTISLSSFVAHIPLVIADKSLAWLWKILAWFAALPIATWIHAIPNHYLLFFMCGAFVLLLVPAGMPGCWLGLFWLLPAFYIQQEKPAQSNFWVSLIDVGQGLSVLVQTNQHVLLFDAGPRLNEQSDAGEHIVLPYLHTINIKKVDRLVISHGDNDHIGGATAIFHTLPLQSVLTSVPDKLVVMNATYCLAGYSWQWDGVRFEFLYPSLSDLGKGNDSSCVLRVDNGSHSLLLTGDIEKLSEYKLLQNNHDQLAADILVAPHHGSKTSAERDFINAVHPQYVLYATGYRNRYHFPHKQAIDGYAAINTKQLNTVDTGLIQIRLEKEKAMVEPYLYRIAHKRYWY